MRFSEEKWFARGLNPSAQYVIKEMEIVFNDFVDFFKDKIDKGQLNDSKLENILKNYVIEFVCDSLRFDTEEREFIYDEMNLILNDYGLDIYKILDS